MENSSSIILDQGAKGSLEKSTFLIGQKPEKKKTYNRGLLHTIDYRTELRALGGKFIGNPQLNIKFDFTQPRPSDEI